MDSTLIMIRRPSDREDNRRHGVKLQVLTVPDGMCIHCRGITEGVGNDLYPLEHSTLARVIAVREEGSDGVPVITRPQASTDGGHQEIRHIYLEAVIPHRTPNRHLTEDQREASRLLSQD